ncbi:MAG: LapA family protein [Rhodospirillaceae bacterium]|nr:LapA family protein [Rhodospirillaceae bacterium]
MRRLISWIIILPTAAVVVVFALNNRGAIAIDLWPFGIVVEMPVYLAFILVFGVGAVLGGVASIMAGSKARSRYSNATYDAEVKRREMEKLSAKCESLEADKKQAGQSQKIDQKIAQNIISPPAG